MFGYYLYLLYRCLKHTDTTVIGYENHIKRTWIERMLQVEPKDRGQAISVIGSNMSAATSMSSISLTLSSLIGAWVGSSSQNIFKSGFIYGDTSSSTISIKYISLLACFLLAFACFVQSASWLKGSIPCCHLAAVDFWPIPMFVSSVILVVIMHNLDTNSNPLHQFQPANKHNLLKKIGEEISAVASAIEHHERPSENGSSGASDSQH
ncbi:hypothetical protein CK203_021583 [Vitis vinifera]|uniref:Uncharacterized protein n=1 Tax=Vitis vinifera TaxID=29760 RepID=A0A438J4Q8_VITVI|nr:hypothetical protein CK203_021583 [Vitis vinifera]